MRFFLSGRFDVVQQSPKNSKTLLDMELIKISKRYTSTLNHYQKMLKERNSILKREKVDPVLFGNDDGTNDYKIKSLY